MQTSCRDVILAGEERDFGFHEHGGEFVADLDAGGDFDAGEVVGVFARGGEREGVVEAVRHEGDGMAEAAEVCGERGAPGARANDGEIHRAETVGICAGW